MPEVKYKLDFYELYDLGYFGNRALSWNSYRELLQSGWTKDVCIRGKGIPRPDARYNIPLNKVQEEIDLLVRKGYPESILRFNQSMPDYALVIQGEVIRWMKHPPTSTGPLELTYTTVKSPMNEALLEETKHASGLIAKMILQSTMDDSSFTDLQALLEIYSDSVVEFSTYSVAVGDIDNRNTVFWEVRNY